MLFLSHRGYWDNDHPKNSIKAFERSFDLGFGTETDFRDRNGILVISHDPATSGAPPASKFFSTLKARDKSLMVAMNVKSDGLQSMFKQAVTEHGIENYFLFDMSVPDALASIRAGLRVFTRQSDFEPVPNFYQEAAGVWMDAFLRDDWLTPGEIALHLNAGKQVCLVSPELHGRPHLPFWKRMLKSNVHLNPSVILCTDIPESAKFYFNQ
jgi:hypothetical protein